MNARCTSRRDPRGAPRAFHRAALRATAPLCLGLPSLRCVPEFDARNSLVAAARILVVVAEPAEARPGTRIDYEALVVGPSGREAGSSLRWTHCVTPRPLIGNGPVSDQCLSERGVPLEVQSGSTASGALPLDACARFGPDPPPGEARPRDADATGGFYQPLRLDALGGTWLHFQRLLCPPRNAPADVARQFAGEYVHNQNPLILALELRRDGERWDTESIPASTLLELRVRWPSEAAEDYVWMNPETSEVEPRREELTVSWFSTAGSFDADRTPAQPGDAGSDNRWLAPAAPARARIWVILRDDRGGAAILERSLEVR